MNKIFAVLLCLMLPVWSYGAVDFDGSADYVDIGTVGTFGSGMGDGITLSAWVKYTSESNSYIFGGRDSVATNMQMAWETRHDGSYQTNERIWIRDSDGKYLIGYINGYDNLNDGFWHHVAIAINGVADSMAIYVDGDSKSVSYQLQQTPDNFTDFTSALALACYNSAGTPGNYWDGSIDDVRLYSRILDSTEIENLGLSRSRLTITDGLIAWWRLDEYGKDVSVLGSLFNDYSGEGNTSEGKGSASLVTIGSELISP